MLRIRSRSHNAQTCVAMVSHQGCVLADVLPALYSLLAADVDLAIRSGEAMVSRARSELATKLIDEEGYERLLWIDDDIIFTQRDAFELLSVDAPHSDLLGAIYARRGSAGQEWACELEPGAPTQPLQRARWVGTGFLLTHRRVYERIRKQYGWASERAIVPYFLPALLRRPDGREEFFAGEDISFCARAWCAGVQPFVAPHVRVRHRESVDTLPTHQEERTLCHTTEVDRPDRSPASSSPLR